MENSGRSERSGRKVDTRKEQKLTSEDKSYLARDMEYSVEQIQDYIDAYVSCSMVLRKHNEDDAKKELRAIIDEYLQKMHTAEWLRNKEKQE